MYPRVLSFFAYNTAIFTSSIVTDSSSEATFVGGRTTVTTNNTFLVFDDGTSFYDAFIVRISSVGNVDWFT